MKIGILQTGHSPEGLIAEYGDYGEMFVRLLGGNGFDFQIFSVVDMEIPTSITQADAWLITGSRFGAYDDLPWIAPLEDFVRAVITAKIPMLGICFGHQIVAQALGGTVQKYSGGWSVGATQYALRGSETTVTLNAWHQDQVTKLPDSAQIEASSQFCENAIVTYGDDVLTIQAHPEFGAGFVQGLIEKRGRGVVPDDLLEDARQRLDVPASKDWVTKRMVDFIMQPRG